MATTEVITGGVVDYRARAEEELKKMRENCQKWGVTLEIKNLREYVEKAGISLADIGTSEEELRKLLMAYKSARSWLRRLIGWNDHRKVSA
jgi:hypothetical protein